MPAIDYETEYNNRAPVPEHQEIFDRWEREAEEYRREKRPGKRADLGLSYGTTERQTIDLFYPQREGRTTPLAVFIHGGYWRSLEPAMFSHVARGLNEHGFMVAVVGYDLAPRVRISEIVRQIRQACLFLYGRFGQRMLVYGHSAGGHLAACAVGTDWSVIDPDAPADLAPAGVAISGVFELEPLLHTSMNADLKLDPEEVPHVSPASWPVPADRALHAVVGGLESSEFLRQSRVIADAWKARGAETEYETLPGANHFTVVDPLADPRSALNARLVRLAQRLD
jgi:arylformamidase